MKKWLLLFCLSIPILANAQTPPALAPNTVGTYSLYNGAPAGANCYGVWYQNFSTPTLPSDAVITGMYPAATVDYSGGAPVLAVAAGSSAGCGSAYYFSSAALPITQENLTSSIGTSLSILSSYQIMTAVNMSLGSGAGTNVGHTYGVGVAIYYTSATPKVDHFMKPPIPVPVGTGVAWSIPTSFTQTGVIINDTCGHLFTDACGFGLGAIPARYQYGLTGLFKYPDGQNVNGYLRVRMNSANTKNVCVSPYQVVPTINLSYNIVNGTAVGLDQSWYSSTDCLSPRHPYYIEVSDTKNKLIYADNWYVPRLYNTDVIDVGAMASENFGGPIQVSIPVGIISTPITNQSITQPTGTALDIYGTVNFHGNVTYATPPSFTTLTLTSLGIGVAPSYPLDVVGIINTSQGIAIGGNVGTAGYYLASGGPGAPDQWLPLPSANTTFYYQYARSGTTTLPQEQYIKADGTSLVAVDDGVGGNTVFSIRNSGVTAGTYTNPASLTVDVSGRITAITGGGSATSRVCNANGCYRIEADGTQHQWGTLFCGSTTCNVTFANACTTTANSAFVATTAYTIGNGNITTVSSGISTTGTTVMSYGEVNVGGSGRSYNGGGTIHWMLDCV